MAEVQQTTQSGEMTQRFIEFVMMQAQNAALFLGQIPNPQTGEAEVNLDVARMFIEQLIMIREKTRGNLTSDEEKVLAGALSNLQMAFVEASKAPGAPAASGAARPAAPPADLAGGAAAAPEAPAPGVQEGVSVSAPEPSESETRKRFTKSYG